MEQFRKKIRVGISVGDLNGVGMEVIFKTFMDKRMMDFCTPIVFSSSKTASFHRKVNLYLSIICESILLVQNKGFILYIFCVAFDSNSLT